MEYTDVTLNMLNTGRQPSPEEKVRFDAWMIAFMKGREFERLEFESGNFDPVQWKSTQLSNSTGTWLLTLPRLVG